MLNTVSPTVPEKMDPQPGQISFNIFTRDSNLGVHSPYSSDFILPPVPFAFFVQIEGVAGSAEVYQGPGSLKSRTSFQRSTCFGVLIRCLGVAEAARNLCGQWRDIL